jgi:hypothetical protein
MQVFETIGHRLVLIGRSYFCVGVRFQIPQGVSPKKILLFFFLQRTLECEQRCLHKTIQSTKQKGGDVNILLSSLQVRFSIVYDNLCGISIFFLFHVPIDVQGKGLSR